MRKIFVLLVIIFVFWLGLRLGELRTLERTTRDDARMMMMQNTMPATYGAGAAVTQ